ncbi:MAG: hypothetical protein PVG30_05530 [Gammaproteobacteria bacterium]
MLPRISDYVGHKRIMQEFNLDHAPPKNLLDHWSLFRSLIECSKINTFRDSIIGRTDKKEIFLGGFYYANTNSLNFMFRN